MVGYSPLRRAHPSDVFFRQKCDTFSRSSQAVFELSTRFHEPAQVVGSAADQAKKNRLIFLELTQSELSPQPAWPADTH